jgi:hypothetical protein
MEGSRMTVDALPFLGTEELIEHAIGRHRGIQCIRPVAKLVRTLRPWAPRIRMLALSIPIDPADYVDGELFALRALAKGPQTGYPKGFIAYGRRRGASAKFGRIPPRHFEAGEMNFRLLQLKDGDAFWYGVRFIDLDDLTKKQIAAIFEVPLAAAVSSKDLDTFLAAATANGPVGTDELCELLERKFPGNDITRETVRLWVADHPDIKLGRGRPKRPKQPNQ